MTPGDLFNSLAQFTDRLLADPRWQSERDDLGVEVVGMLLYGYALALGRMVMLLDQKEIDAAVLRVLTERLGVAAKWGGGLVAQAHASAFDQAHHPTHYALIGVGHSYLSMTREAARVENAYANLKRIRHQVEGR